MTSPAQTQPDAPLDVDDVLDAAADAFVNDGLDAVSIRRVASSLEVDAAELDDLFPSVEQLLVSMLNREFASMSRAIADDVERDPLGGRLSRIYRYGLAAVYERPLARALYLMDRDGLNRIVRATHGLGDMLLLSIQPEFIERMKEAGAVRDDVDAEALSAVISAVSAGTALLAPRQDLNRVIDGLVNLLEAAVDTDAPDTSRGKAVFLAYATGPSEDPAYGLER